MKLSQEATAYLRGRSGVGPFWNADWEVRIGVLQELDRLCKTNPKERILNNAYNELLTELKTTAKSAAVMRTLGEGAKKLLGI